jgi:hypothetical protein
MDLGRRATVEPVRRPSSDRRSAFRPPRMATWSPAPEPGRGHDFRRIRVGAASDRAAGTSSELWFFDGVPGNDSHPTETTLTTPAAPHRTFAWDVVEGASHVELLADGSSSSARTGRTNAVRLRSRRGSDGQDDVRIRASETSPGGSVLAHTDYRLGVRTPAGIRAVGQATTVSGRQGPATPGAFPVPGGQSSDDVESLAPEERAEEETGGDTEEPTAAPKSMSHLSTTHGASATWGYETRVKYQVLDDTGAVMSGYDVNERWSTGVVNDASPCDWRRGPAGGVHVAGSDFDDVIQGESAGHIPTPLAPSGGSARVQHWGQQWYVGSVTPGTGTLVQTNTLQKYQDHATHDSVVSPPSLAARAGSGLRQFFGL